MRKRRVVGRIYGMKYSRKGHKDRNRHKFKWYGHVSRSSGLAKTILQDTVKGVRRQGRLKNRWEDNNRKWTDLEYAKSQRAVENREE